MKSQQLFKFQVPKGFRGRSSVVTQLWWITQATIIRMSPQPFYFLRSYLWRLFGAKLGKGVKIRPTARVTYPWKVELGDHCWVGDRAELYSLEKITIGSNTCISQDAYICTGSHDINSESFCYDCKPIEIGCGVWIATGAFVFPGLTVVDGVVLGARSVATTDLMESGVYVGHPARKLKERSICR